MANTANIKAVITAEDRASAALRGFGNKVAGVGQKIAGAMKIAAVAAGAAAASLAFYAVNQFRDLQKNTAGIQALTKNTAEAKRVLKDAIDFVQGKPFDRLDTIGAAKQLLAFGRTAGQIKDDLDILGRTVLISGIDWTHLTRVYGRVISSGKLLREDFNILNDAGVGLAKTLQKNLGLSMEKVFERMSEGKITAKDFKEALEDAAPSSAVQNSLNTFDNKLISLKAKLRDVAFAVLGVDFNSLGEDTEPLVKEGGLLDRLTDGMDSLTNALKNIDFASVNAQLGQWARTIKEVGARIWNFLSPALKDLWETIKTELAPALKDLWDNNLKKLIPLIGGAFVLALKGAIIMLDKLTSFLSGVIQVAADLSKFFGETLPNSIKSGIDDLRQKWDKTWQIMENKVETVKRNINRKIEEIKKPFATVLDAVREFTNKFKNNFSGGIQEGLDKANNALASYINGTLERWGKWGESVIKSARESLNSVTSFFEELPGKVGGKLTRFKDTVTGKFRETKASIVEFVRSSREDITKFFSELPGKVSEALSNAIGNIKEFFTNLASNIFESTDKAGKDVVDNMTDSSKKALTEVETIRKVGDAIGTMIGLAVIAALVYIVDAGYRAATALISGWQKSRAESKAKIREWLSGVFAAIGEFFVGVGRWLWDSGVALVRGFVGGIASAKGEITKALRTNISNPIKNVPLVSGGGTSVSKILRGIIPGFATGTSFAPGGTTLVGERGPELVSLPRGSKVEPNDKTRKMGGGDTINITIQAGAFMGSQQDARRYAEMIMRAWNDVKRANPGKAIA